MNTINKLFAALENLQGESRVKESEITSKIQALLDDQYKGWKALQDILNKLESYESVEYFGDEYGDIYSFIRFPDVLDVPEQERDYFEAYLADRGVSVNYENEYLAQCLGGEEIVIQDDHGRANGIYQGHNLIIDEIEYLDDNGDVDVTKRNALIESHMEKTGWFPGVFCVTRSGDICPVKTQA